MVRVGVYEVVLVDSASGVALPEVMGPDGKHYAVAQPGEEFTVKCTNHSGRSCQAEIFVDSEKVDMDFNTRTATPFTFHGFPMNSELTKYKAFRFAAAQIAEPGEGSGANGADADNGTITTNLYAAHETNEPADASWVPMTMAGTDTKLVKKRGKKFFMSASLTTQGGSRVTANLTKATHRWVRDSNHPLAQVKIHTETLETLRLRGIPVPPAIVRNFFDAKIGAAAAGVGAAAGAGAGASANDNESVDVPAAVSSRKRKRVRHQNPVADDDEVWDLT